MILRTTNILVIYLNYFNLKVILGKIKYTKIKIQIKLIFVVRIKNKI